MLYLFLVSDIVILSLKSREAKIMKASTLKIGILNIMHDKLRTRRRFEEIFAQSPFEVELTFFYPKTHYRNRSVPFEVAAIAEPLDLERVKEFDGFIITGSPIERFDFEEVTYIDEIRCLLAELDCNHVQQLYLCWGAMAAMNYFYGTKKKNLPEKIFGVFPHQINYQNGLLAGINSGFLAPHARYEEMDKTQIEKNPDLRINAEDENGNLFLVTAPKNPERVFLFSHLEYDQPALLEEYQRETAAHPENTYKKPENYFLDEKNMQEPQFKWEKIQKLFFFNWLNQVSDSTLEPDLVII